jgi:hypothetical protein
MDADSWLALAGLIGGGVAFSAGLFQYRQAQRWKRSEFAANEAKEMLDDQEVAIALRLLDWNAKSYDLSDDGRYPDLADVLVDDGQLTQALTPHERRPDGFSPVEVRIRDCVDALLWHLQRLEHFIETGLIRVDDVRPYLRYWMDLIGNVNAKRKSPATLYALWEYMDAYGYDDVQRLFQRFGYDVRTLPGHVERVSIGAAVDRSLPGAS